MSSDLPINVLIGAGCVTILLGSGLALAMVMSNKNNRNKNNTNESSSAAAGPMSTKAPLEEIDMSVSILPFLVGVPITILQNEYNHMIAFIVHSDSHFDAVIPSY